MLAAVLRYTKNIIDHEEPEIYIRINENGTLKRSRKNGSNNVCNLKQQANAKNSNNNFHNDQVHNEMMPEMMVPNTYILSICVKH